MTKKSILVHLLSVGCDVNIQNQKRESPLVIAILSNNAEIVEILLDAGADHVNTNFYGNFGPLHFAAERGYAEIIKLLLKAGADVKAVNVGRRTALHMAIATEYKDDSTCRSEAVRALIHAGSDVNAKDDSDETPLHCAVNYDRSDVLELLLDAGADVQVPDCPCPPLHLAIERNKPHLAKRLVEVGTNVNNWRDQEARTFLHLAVASAKPAMVKLLLEAGASVDVCDKDDLDPLCYGLKTRSADLNKQMSSRFNKGRHDDCDHDIETLYPNLLHDQTECTRLLLKHGKNINRVNKSGLTALLVAVQDCNHSEVVRFLLENGAIFDPNHPIVRDVILSENGSSVPYLLLRHAALFEAQNPKGGSLNFEVRRALNGYRLGKHREKCKQELESMKNSWIYGSVSFFSVLLRDKDIGPYVRDEQLDKAFVKQFAEKKFPIYCDLLVERFDRLMEMRRGNANNNCTVM
ncbi:serine/threonine-protein phosphatase 6 regulatory ankyrin repeat subunit B-like [Copidosoma floridanum]|uniref:serine/threonine-protein phosphatase 6 regulatory ankyrin repeat subunit B-like n=1 Tax=Copidosoma floridanum TaxID=29053 RepID=UPI0006C99AFF|nr:serine/threonine-protein phosphatase 6 regulatory ankyrin repeat subunit B-like [Copidosoma floridanum]